MNASERARENCKIDVHTNIRAKECTKLVKIIESRRVYCVVGGCYEKPVGNWAQNFSVCIRYYAYSLFIAHSPATYSTQNTMANIELEMLKNVLCLAASISTHNGDQQCEKHPAQHQHVTLPTQQTNLKQTEPTQTTNYTILFERCHSHRHLIWLYMLCMMLNRWKGIWPFWTAEALTGDWDRDWEWNRVGNRYWGEWNGGIEATQNVNTKWKMRKEKACRYRKWLQTC